MMSNIVNTTSKTFEFNLPVKVSEPKKNMNTCIIFGKEKCGKTTALSKLENCLIIDTEKGTEFVKSKSIQVPESLGPVSRMRWLNELCDHLISEGKPYDYVAIDTFSEVNEWAEWSGTYRYMMSPMGKSFNRVKDSAGRPIKDGPLLTPDDPEYLSVHTLPEGFGYRWSRDEVLQIFEKLKLIAKKCVIFVCHIEDKYIANKDLANMVPTKQLALTGKIRDLLPRKVDAIGYVYNEGGKVMINFTGSEEKTGGARAQHLRGFNGELDWDKIFIPEDEDESKK